MNIIRTEVVDFSVLRKDYEETDTFSFLGEVCYSVEKAIKV